MHDCVQNTVHAVRLVKDFSFNILGGGRKKVVGTVLVVLLEEESVALSLFPFVGLSLSIVTISSPPLFSPEAIDSPLPRRRRRRINVTPHPPVRIFVRIFLPAFTVTIFLHTYIYTHYSEFLFLPTPASHSSVEGKGCDDAILLISSARI